MYEMVDRVGFPDRSRGLEEAGRGWGREEEEKEKVGECRRDRDLERMRELRIPPWK